MPNSLAYITIILWPIIAILLYRQFRTIPATFITIVGGYLILPVDTAIDLPFVPAINKASVSALSALLGCILVKNIKISFIPKRGLEKWLVVIYILLPILTFMTNTEPVYDGRFWRQGLSYHDAISGVISNYILLIPFIIGMQIIRNHNDILALFKYLTIAGLFYSLPILLEIRLSPQLHTWIYGFFPHNFGQQIRGGGYRPVVFLGHGLLVATFMTMTLASATVLWKNRINTFGFPSITIIFYLAIILIFSKTLGAYFLALLVLPAIIIGRSSIINIISRVIIFIIILYPLLTIFKIFPQQEIVEFVNTINTDRAMSLLYRFENENILIEHAYEKFIFGWGVWDRNRPWGTVTDGYWIIVLGVGGFVGFIAIFGLALVAVIKGFKATKKLSNTKERTLFSSYVLLIVVIMIDQIPNHSMHGYLWLLLGAALGRSNYILKQPNSL